MCSVNSGILIGYSTVYVIQSIEEKAAFTAEREVPVIATMLGTTVRN
jgi:hypothetical protein